MTPTDLKQTLNSNITLKMIARAWLHQVVAIWNAGDIFSDILAMERFQIAEITLHFHSISSTMPLHQYSIVICLFILFCVGDIDTYWEIAIFHTFSTKQNSFADTHRNSNVTDKSRLMMMIVSCVFLVFIEGYPIKTSLRHLMRNLK